MKETVAGVHTNDRFYADDHQISRTEKRCINFTLRKDEKRTLLCDPSTLCRAVARCTRSGALPQRKRQRPG